MVKAQSEQNEIRAFVALSLGSEARDSLARAALSLVSQPWAREVRWVEAQNLHLTLRFLGNIASAGVPGIVQTLEAALREFDAFEFVLRDLVCFPSANRPRVIAARVSSEESVAALAFAVERALAGSGRESEGRGFRPHITLGRFRRSPRGKKLDLAACEVEPVAVAVSDVVLYRSTLDPAGVCYSELGRIELGATHR
ncbi:MAG: RNA 2',3'-cyclic phosphodiesterase [bacterium]|nr:RNA 2',3'-cyclic phosphodiesterase [bacterium]MCP5040839.1 RNA 2',3'-cyclic phosphodiesterase [bacterium]